MTTPHPYQRMFGRLVLAAGWAISTVPVFGQVSVRRALAPEWSLGEGVVAGQTVTGPRLPYRLTLPGGWTLKPVPDRAFESEAVDGELSLGVNSGFSADTTISLVENMRAALKKAMVSCDFGALTEVKIDGRPWMQCSVRIEDPRMTGWFTYQYYLYADAKGAFVIAAWRRGPFKNSDEASIRDVATSFRFPVKPVPKRAPPVPFFTPPPGPPGS